jgi:hypothetical protein
MLDKHIYYVPTESRAADWGRRSGDVLCIIQYYNDCMISIIDLLMISCIMYYTVLLFIIYCICVMYFYTLGWVPHVRLFLSPCLGVSPAAG